MTRDDIYKRLLQKREQAEQDLHMYSRLITALEEETFCHPRGKTSRSYGAVTAVVKDVLSQIAPAGMTETQLLNAVKFRLPDEARLDKKLYHTKKNMRACGAMTKSGTDGRWRWTEVTA
jgi:hypothetical protein